LGHLGINDGQVAKTEEQAKTPRTVYDHIDVTLRNFALDRSFMSHTPPPVLSGTRETRRSNICECAGMSRRRIVNDRDEGSPVSRSTMDRRHFVALLGTLGAGAAVPGALEGQPAQTPAPSYEEVRSKLAGTKLFIVPHAHNDYGWLNTHLWDAAHLPLADKEALEIMRRERDFKWYVDVEFEAMSLFLEQYPELLDELKDRVREGRWGIAAGSFCPPQTRLKELEAPGNSAGAWPFSAPRGECARQHSLANISPDTLARPMVFNAISVTWRLAVKTSRRGFLNKAGMVAAAVTGGGWLGRPVKQFKNVTLA
jgi:hypothetical protein